MTSGGPVTVLLRGWREGDADAFNRLVPLVQDELHRIAVRCMKRERAGHSLQATALVNEAYIRLIDVQLVNWQDRAHFIAMAARLMRRVLVDHARARHYRKRGGGALHITLDGFDVAAGGHGTDVLALHDALSALGELDLRKSKVIELRFFGGLSVEETAHVLEVSQLTVMRDWKFAKAWLFRELNRA